MYALAGTMNHLTRILGDMTNAIEQLGMQRKEKSLTIVAGSYTRYKAGDVVEIISNYGRRWVSRVVEGMEALGTWLDSRGCTEATLCHRISKGNTMFFAKKALLCCPKLPVKRRTHPFIRRVLLRCFMVLVSGPTHSQCFRHYASGNLANFVVCCASRRRPNECWADHMKRTVPIAARQLEKLWSTTFTHVGDATCVSR